LRLTARKRITLTPNLRSSPIYPWADNRDIFHWSCSLEGITQWPCFAHVLVYRYCARHLIFVEFFRVWQCNDIILLNKRVLYIFAHLNTSRPTKHVTHFPKICRGRRVKVRRTHQSHPVHCRFPIIVPLYSIYEDYNCYLQFIIVVA